MKVLFISRATLYSARGGDTVQIENTASHLRQLQVEVDIKLCDDPTIQYKQYDLIHFFNIIRPADIIFHIDKSKLPFVVSPIYVNYEEITRVNKQWLMYRFLSLFSRYTQEYVKCIARSIKNKERIISRKYIWLGHRRAIAYILKRCAWLLPNSHSEYNRLKADFKQAGEYNVIPNSIDNAIFHRQPLKREKAVLCVARIEPFKNQLNVIRALEGTGIHLTLAGDPAPNHQAYYQECLQAAGPTVTFIPHQAQTDIATLYNQHQTHILASWFETTGLSSLEAAACGCAVVITDKGDTREYFEDYVEYCDPGNLESIRTAVQRAMQAPANQTFANTIASHNNWHETARKTLDVYKKVCHAAH